MSNSRNKEIELKCADKLYKWACKVVKNPNLANDEQEYDFCLSLVALVELELRKNNN